MVPMNLALLLLFLPPPVLVLRSPTTALVPTLVLTTLAQPVLVLLPLVLVLVLPLLVTMRTSTLVLAILAYTPTIPLVTTAL